MSQISYAKANAPRPTLNLPKREDEGAAGVVRPRGRRAAFIPLIISLVVQWVFFLHYWLPETIDFPARIWWLTQLAPLASPLLTSGGEPQVAAQQGLHFGAVVLLAAGFLLFWLSRTPQWWGRMAMVVPAGIGLVAALGILVELTATGTMNQSAVAVLLILIWLFAAGYSALAGWQNRMGVDRPKGWRNGIVLLIAYVVLVPFPTAVGRALFAPELRDVAASLQENTTALRLAALWTESTLLLCLAGALVGITVYLAYQWWPPRRDRRFVSLSVAVISMVIVTGAVGLVAAAVSAQRVTTLIYGSPADEVNFSCGSWVLDPPAGPGQVEPKQTIVISGLSCRTVTTFTGYRQLSTYTSPVPLSPVIAYTPEGGLIDSKIVAAQYGEVLVVATTDRPDNQANRLVGLRFGDLTQVWELPCGDVMFVRFALVPAGENPTLGHITIGEDRPTVVANCAGLPVLFDPITGPPT